MKEKSSIDCIVLMQITQLSCMVNNSGKYMRTVEKSICHDQKHLSDW